LWADPSTWPWVADRLFAELAEYKAGTHICAAIEKQYPGMLNTDNDSMSVNVKLYNTTYL
jgi:hypothetical protein